MSALAVPSRDRETPVSARIRVGLITERTMAVTPGLSTRTNTFPHHKDANANIKYGLIKYLLSLPNLPGNPPASAYFRTRKREPFGSLFQFMRHYYASSLENLEPKTDPNPAKGLVPEIIGEGGRYMRRDTYAV